MLLKRSWPAVSHSCRRTVVEVSMSSKRLVRNEAPTVEGVVLGAKVPWMKRWRREVLPTPAR